MCGGLLPAEKQRENPKREKRETETEKNLRKKKKVGNENRFMSKLYVGVVIKMVTNL